MKLCIPAAFVGVFLFIVGCQPKAAQEPVTILLNPWPGYTFLYLAREKGFFEDADVQVKLIDQASLSDSASVYAHGQIDMVCGTIVEAVVTNSSSSRDPLTPLVYVDYSSGADMLLARPGITSVEELKGKKVAIEPESLDPLMVALALEGAGLEFSDVELVPMSQREMEAAFVSGAVDAIQTYHPVSTAVFRKHPHTRVWDSSESVVPVLDMIMVKQSFLAQFPEKAAAIRDAYMRAVAFYRLNPDEGAEVLAPFLAIAPAEVDSSFDGIQLIHASDQEEIDASLSQIAGTTRDLLRQIGMVEGDHWTPLR